MLAHNEGTKVGKDAPRWDSATEDRLEATQKKQQTLAEDQPYFNAPGRNAMAGVLLTDWAHGKVDIGKHPS